MFESDRLYDKGGDSAGTNKADTQKSLYLYAGRLLSQGKGSVAGVWLDGVRVPLSNGASPWSASKSKFSDASSLTSELDALRAAAIALIPGSVNNKNEPQRDTLAGNDSAVLGLWYDIEAEMQALAASRDWQTYKVSGNAGGETVGDNNASGWLHRSRLSSTKFAPALRAYWGDGSGADGVRSTSDIVQRAIDKVPGWRETDTCNGITWALVEMRQWQLDKQLWPFSPGSVPRLDFLVRGNPDIAHPLPGLGANPAKAAKWYLTEVCGVNEGNLDGFDEAAEVCERELVFPEVARGRATSPIDWEDVLALFYKGALPSTSVQDKVLAEWNRREAGAANKRYKYSANGIITSDMSREAVLNALAASMAGDITEIGGKWYCRAGDDTRASVVTIGESLLLGSVDWIPDSRSTDKPNVLEASITQDRDRGWSNSEIPEIVNTENVAADGRQVQSISLPMVNDMLDAQRLLTIVLRRDSYGLRTADAWTLKVPSAASPQASLVPGDFVQVDDVDGFTGRMRITSVAHGLGTVTLSAVECPASVYADNLLLEGTVKPKDNTQKDNDVGDSGLGMNAGAEWRGAGSNGWKMDLRLEWGRNVQSAEVKVEPTTPQGFERPTVTAPDNYPPPESDDTTDRFVLVPVTVSVAGPAPSGEGSGGNTVIYPVENSWTTVTVSRHSTAPANSRTRKVTVPLREVDTSFENVVYAQEDDWDFKVTGHRIRRRADEDQRHCDHARQRRGALCPLHARAG